MKINKTSILILACTLFFSLQSYGSIKVLMKLEGVDVPKEFSTKSQIQKFEDWIEIFGASSGFAVSVDSAGSRSASRPSYSDFTIVKRADEISPILTLSGVSGKSLSKVTVVWLASGGQASAGKAMEFIMENVLVSSSAMAGSDGEDFGTESVSFNWAKLTMNSYTQDPKTGEYGEKPSTSVTIDAVQNTVE